MAATKVRYPLFGIVPTQSQEVLRTALAMGADRGIDIEVSGKDYELLQPIHVSQILIKLAQDETTNLVASKQSMTISTRPPRCSLGLAAGYVCLQG